MPKRRLSSGYKTKKNKKQKLSAVLKELEQMRRRIQVALSSSSSSSPSSLEESSENEENNETVSVQVHAERGNDPDNEEMQVAVDEVHERGTVEKTSTTGEIPQELISVLGAKPQDSAQEGPELHEEIVVRWNSYLTKGVTKDDRAQISEKYPIPKNCQALLPPKVNAEIVGCMNDVTTKKDYFLKSLQHQIGHGLAAIGSVMDTLIKDDQKSDHLPRLADASLIFGNVHNAISIMRKQNILPMLNVESQKVGHSAAIDEYLFGSSFGESLKSNQALRKTSGEIRKKIWRPPTVPAPAAPLKVSQTEPQKNTRHLNYQRKQFKSRMKEGKTQQEYKRAFKGQHHSQQHQYRRRI